MIPTPILLLLHCFFGLAVAFASRNATRLSARSTLSSRASVAMVVSEAMLGVPVGTYLYVFHRDWSLLYLVDGSEVPSAVAVGIIAAYPLAAIAGFALGVALLRARRDALLGGVLVFVLLAAALLTAFFRNRVLQVGPFGGFHGGYGMRPLGGSALLPVAATLTASLFIGWTYVVWRAARESRPQAP